MNFSNLMQRWRTKTQKIPMLRFTSAHDQAKLNYIASGYILCHYPSKFCAQTLALFPQGCVDLALPWDTLEPIKEQTRCLSHSVRSSKRHRKFIVPVLLFFRVPKELFNLDSGMKKYVKQIPNQTWVLMDARNMFLFVSHWNFYCSLWQQNRKQYR